MLVEIVGDPAQLLEPDEFECVVSAVHDYVSVVQQVKRAVASRTPLWILVRDPTCTVWLERFAASYSDAVVRYSVVTARDLLAEHWQTAIPDHVTDEAIFASGFLETDIVPRAGQSYDELVLEHYWGEFFTFVRFPLPLAGELVDSLEPARWKTNRERPLVMAALQACRQRWLDRAKRQELKELIQAVFGDPKKLKDRLGRYKLLQRYPQRLGQTVLGEWYAVFNNLDVDPSPVNLDGVDLGDTIQEIQYYLNNLEFSITDQADLEAVLDEMSGWLPEELDWLMQQLRDKGELQPTSQFPSAIAARFHPIREQVASQLTDLETVIPPDYPSDPSGKRTVQEWVNWAVHDFLPYRFWLEENDRWDDTVASYATTYADWFYENYVDFKYQYQDRWVFSLLNSAILSLKAGRKVLFVVVDNLNFKHLRALFDEFSKRGFRPAGEVKPVWAPIPTTTNVSKWCLVAGEPDLSNVQGRGYQDILDKDWKDHFGEYKVTYLSKLGDLKKRRRFSEALILLNYLPIDSVLHSDEQQIGMTHTGEILGYLRTLVTEVSSFAKRARVEQNLDIYIASDHGSTKIPPTVGNVIDDKFYRNRAKDRHHRYITVPENRATNPTDYDQSHCYVVRADAFGTREHYFIARGYGRFIETNESIYIHGGLTPEETIVPFCKLAKIEIEARQPTIRLPDNVVRYSVKANLVFVVGNPNDYDISDVELNVAESDLPGTSVEIIPAGTSTEVTVPVRIKRQPGDPSLEAITVGGSFELQGQSFSIEPVQVPVETRSLMESKTEFDFDV